MAEKIAYLDPEQGPVNVLFELEADTSITVACLDGAHAARVVDNETDNADNYYPGSHTRKKGSHTLSVGNYTNPGANCRVMITYKTDII
jgi:hypothetical protein